MTEPDQQADPTGVEPAPTPEPATPSPELEAVLLGAVDDARAAIVEFSGEDSVGEYLGAGFEDSTSATHRFLAELPGYRGWQWAVVVAACPGAGRATISEVVLVPGPTALLAPQWVPWEERVRPGDLSPGDLLAPPADDPRLAPGYAATGDPQIDEVAVEVGLGRRQVLSLWGRNDTAQRWHDGEYGPGSAMARATWRMCRDCGYYVPLGGALGVMFGVCANEYAADGHVVDAEFGCGAHSDTPAAAGTGSPLYDPYDDGVLDVVDRPQASGQPTESPAEVSEESSTESPVEAPAEAPAESPVETPAES
uniref:DUF3027 domain-containing protein n=1 Tax=Mycolicibacterium gilvum (strain PYR-GCK) TaxID=350054 RepID=A4T7B3_MYCGI|nr:hypothetical protein Mflv_1712 [Mycolicibacterium gilvum PYR-GCK]